MSKCTTSWNESEQSRESCNISQGDSILEDGGTEHDYDGNDEGLDEISELGHGGADRAGASAWEGSVCSPNRSEGSLTHSRIPGDHGGVSGICTLANVGNVSVASWDAASEPTLGTDGGTDQDIAAASGLPEGESDDEDDEEDDDFEAADSLDLGAVALCVSTFARSCFRVCIPADDFRCLSGTCFFFPIGADL